MTEKSIKDIHFTKYSDLLPQVLERVIDARYKYLKELDFENHTHARKILKEEYEPAVNSLKTIIETLTMMN